MSKRRFLRSTVAIVLGMVMLVVAACSPQEDLATFNT